ncbi:cytochrome C assembly family protein [Psychrobacter sp. AOP22-C1-22]|uniref:cytochrome C assembly family protein n=1 Tax=unclassified Psychrobacter TaxID=196806 RepID=UPI0017881BA4|nr:MULTISPECIES: cytochrome c biogenesis protein CcsA [unclassified Psychrobacter]MBE0406889.1 cytochrome c biogenesis protein CcsA [Psychrobacter sp. FME6]MBE0445030.1 cytochrome c biogenesis protein CcsA [Psychrobacter sp. FME5]MDN5892177.1 cytochrome c biogenesis protein CcsA [Psychrobacter sp.]
MQLVFLLAGMAYLLVSIHIGWALIQNKPIYKSISLGLLSIGMLAHATLLYPHVVTLYGLNFNLFNIISLISLFFLFFYVMFSLYRPIVSLGILAAPTAFIGMVVGYIGRAPYRPITDISIGLEAHILLSLAAYCVLLMAAVQALFLRLQIRELKHQSIHRFWVNKLPSLQSMESLLFDMLLVGFVLLSIALGIGIGIIYVEDLMAQHLAHKTVFSLLSWLLFGALLLGNWRAGWRGKRAANITIYAFILLAIGFVGSKFVLEMLL